MKQTAKNVSPFSNEARNTYVIEHITESLLKSLRQKPIGEISISEICDSAGVGRASFYRNFESKEDILLKHIQFLVQGWNNLYEQQEEKSNAAMYGSLFAHLKSNSDFYMLLQKQNLMHLFLSVFVEFCGAKPEDDNMWAYTKSFIAYGTYGWIGEWIARGMQESAESMTTLLNSHGMK